MSRHRGRVCVALAAKMQKQFPFTEFVGMNREVVRVPLLWEAANLYPALGCYTTMTELIRPGNLTIGADGEVTFEGAEA